MVVLGETQDILYHDGYLFCKFYLKLQILEDSGLVFFRSR